jgi:hypothetical protein
MEMAFVCEKKLKFLWKEKVKGGGHSQNKGPKIRQ